MVEPQFKVSKRLSNINALANKLTGWPKAEDRKPREQRRTIKQVQAKLASLGFQSSYGRVGENLQRQQKTPGSGGGHGVLDEHGDKNRGTAAAIEYLDPEFGAGLCAEFTASAKK